MGWFRGAAPVPPAPNTITGITLSNSTFIGGSADGTVVGAISVQTNTGSFGGTLTLGGTDAAKFKIVGSNLELNGTQAAGSYSITITATDASFSNSPFTPSAFPITGSSSGASHLWDLTAVNDTASTQTAGTYFLMRGLAFKDGDLAAATYPQLLVSGVAQPYTPFNIVYWPSGNVMWMGALIRPTFSLTAGASQAIGVWNGGTAPTASGRSFTDLYNQSLAFLVDAAPVTGANLTGTWAGYARSDANNYAQYTLGDGGAGLIVELRLKCAQTPGGAAHGQMESTIWAAILNDASNALGGFVVLGRMTQPFWDVNSPAKNFRAFSRVYYQYGGGPTSIDVSGPCNDSTYTTFNFTWSSGQIFAAAGNKLYNGAFASSHGQVIAGYLTTTGTLPPPLATGTIYFATAASSSATTISISNYSTGEIATAGTGAGTGTHTFNPVHALTQFDSLYGATSTGQWQIFQGTGSIVSPSIGRATYAQSYWQSTRILGAFNLSLIGSISNGTFPYTWNPASVGPLFTTVGASGSRPDLGPLTAYSSRHFYTQSKVDEFIVRCVGLASGHFCHNFRGTTNKNFINLSNTSYTGMDAPSSTQRAIGWAPKDGTWTAPPSFCSMFAFDANQFDHMPETVAYAYLVTGEPQFLAGLMEMGSGAMLSHSVPWRNPTSPVNGYGLPAAFATQQRTQAWALRTLGLVAALTPNPFYDGSQIATYFRDQAAKNCDWMINQALAVQLNAYCRSIGMWMAVRNGTQFSGMTAMFELTYLVFGMRFIYALTGDANALSFLKNMVTFYSHLFSTFGGWAVATGFIWHTVTGSLTLPIQGTGAITSDAQLGGIEANLGGAQNIPQTISWTTGNPSFSITNYNRFGYSNPQAGDVVIFGTNNNAAPSGGSYANDTAYYMRDIAIVSTTLTFNLSATNGGIALPAPSTSGSQTPAESGPFIMPQASSTTANSGGNANADSYIEYLIGILQEFMAADITGNSGERVDPLYNDLQTRQTTAGSINWDATQSWARQTSFA